jgi:hypothetical protein
MLIPKSNLIINIIVLNKSKDKTIVFIHGFYANAGYWLPYLPFFKGYKIVLLNLNYFELLNSTDKVHAIFDLVKNLQLGNRLEAIVSHSLGTIISNFICKKSIGFHFDICPVSYALRSDTNGFVNDIKLRINESRFSIRRNLSLVDLLIKDTSEYMSKNSFLYIPDSDKYFSYKSTDNPEYIFKGDHFEIVNAISHITTLL